MTEGKIALPGDVTGVLLRQFLRNREARFVALDRRVIIFRRDAHIAHFVEAEAEVALPTGVARVLSGERTELLGLALQLGQTLFEIEEILHLLSVFIN